MNSAYKLVWSAVFQAWVVASELAKGTKKGSKKAVKSGVVVALITGLGIVQASAAPSLPLGEKVISGNATFSRNIDGADRLLVVNQRTDKLITNWDSFDIAKTGKVIFAQPTSSSIALNRVTSSSVSEILGTLDANGQIFLVNPNGITFGSSAQVRAASIIASTMDIKDANFLKDSLQFEGGFNYKKIENNGSLTSTKGNVVLLSKNIDNQGNVESDQGNIFFVNANKLRLFDHNVSIVQPSNSSMSVIKSTGNLTAHYVEKGRGRVLILGNLMSSSAINLSGKIEAKNINIKGGGVVIDKNLNTFGNLNLELKSPSLYNGQLNVGGVNSVFSLNSLDGSLYVSGRIVFLDSTTRVKINGNFYRKINNIEQLGEIGKNSSTLSERYFLAQDIDASDTATWNNGNGFKPIGSDMTPFTGVIQGFGHQINGLTINRPTEDQVGLFSVISNATVNAVKLSNFNVMGKNNVGALTGIVSGASNIRLYLTDSEVSGNSSVGGIAGFSNGFGSISIDGYNNTISGKNFIGGIAGKNTGILDILGYYHASVSGGNYVGGAVGLNKGKLNLGYDFYFNVSGINNVGGVVGGNSGNMLFYGRINEFGWQKYCDVNCMLVSGINNVGGLVGVNSGVFDLGYGGLIT